MEQHNGHIVSTLMWDTTFDDKALGVGLQDRISHWSNFVMPGELDYVFKQVCPDGMSLSINSLEVDLGEIAVDDLEQQLKIRLEAALREKLADMLRYPASNQNVKLIEQGMASLESLRYFLINGAMPWNYRGDDLNPMVAHLFRKQQMETVLLLRQTGSASTKARKRMAWQFDDENFNETLRGFEPVGHGQINSLSGEMVRLQHKEQFVRSSVADLGKEIRLWILNYLLSDRGTIFNKVAFMKGILEQMANRHNMDYAELLALVEKAIDKPSLAFHVRGDFMTVINMLWQQSQSAGLYRMGRYTEAQELALPATDQKTKKFYADAGEIADNLIEAGYDHCNAVLITLPSGIAYWLKRQKQLDDRFISIFLNACAKTWSPAAVQLVAYFTQLPNGFISYINRQTVRAIGVSCLLTYRDRTDEKSFFDYFLEQAGKSACKTKAAMAYKLCAALASLNPPGMQPEVIAALTEIDAADTDVLPSAAVVHNLNKYYLQVSARGQDRPMLILLRRDLAKLIHRDARAVLKLLRGFKNRVTLFQSIPLLGDEKLIAKLLEADKGAVCKAMKIFSDAMANLNPVSSRTEMALLRRTAYRLAFRALVVYRGISIKLFLKQFVMEAEISGRFSKPLLAALGQGLGLKQPSVLTSIGGLKADVYSGHNDDALILVYQQVLDIKTPLQAILDNLYRHRTNDVLTDTIRQDDGLCSLIFNRFFNNGSREVRQMVDAAGNEVLKSNPEFNKRRVEQTLGDLLWHCFISKAWYQQGIAGLKASFAAAVAYRYPLSKTHTGSRTKEGYSGYISTNISFQRLTAVEQQELTLRIKKAIAEGQNAINWGGRQIDLTEVLFQCILHAPRVGEIFTSGAFSGQEIVRLMHSIDLVRLLQLLKNSRAVSKERVGDIALVNMLGNASGPRLPGDAVLMAIFRQMLLLNKPRANWQRSLEGLVKQLFASITFSKLGASIAGKFNAGGFTASVGIRRLVLSVSPVQQQFVEKLNGEKLKPTAHAALIANKKTSPLREKHQPGLNLLEYKPVIKDANADRNAALYWYRQTGNSSAAALQLRIGAATPTGISISHWYKPGNNFTAPVSRPVNSPMDITGPVNPYWYGLGERLLSGAQIARKGVDRLGPANHIKQNPDTGHQTMLAGDVANTRQKGITDELLKQLIATIHIPSWFNPAPDYRARELAEEIVRRCPDALPNMLRTASLSAAEVGQINDAISFENILDILSRQNNAVKALANEVLSLYIAFGRVLLEGTTGRQLQLLVYRKLLLACKSSNYGLLTAQRIWNELAWDVSVNFSISKDKFIQGASAELQALAPAYRLALGQLIALNKQKNMPAGFVQYQPQNKNSMTIKNENTLAAPILVKNAGVVLLSEYVPTLFRLMELLNGKEFVSAARQLDAVHVLQYAVTGMMETSEVYLPLNKIMCGLRLDDAVADGISLTSAQQELINGMIMNLVGQWTVIGKTSVDGFRGNWLVRDGLLSETEERWELVVEPRPYDILINKFPFSYSIIKYQWMDKPLHVKWKI